ncbi:MAG: FAD-binding oxidoreductase [Gammaproteobacteria bacterium]|nr:FAD-binding oxidoreductase [Gammaproteobacteria bacterium]MCZ6668576.1 FAD-binding oxidoreductase [Gammaproteobacteria bacterium]
MNNNLTVAVVGAGIVGTSCALWLQKKGFSVILIDPEKPGSGTSYGNACTIADYGCVPVNSPTIFKRLPGLLFSKESPLTVDPGYALRHLSWQIRFLRNCRKTKVERISRILGKLLKKTYQGLDPLIEFSGSQHLLSQPGCMYVYKNPGEFKNARAANQLRRDQGVEFTELDAGDIHDLEPNIKLPFEKGLLFDKASQVLNPQSLTTSYLDCLLSNQGRYVQQRALSIDHANAAVSVNLDNGEKLHADRVVIAAGAFSGRIMGTGAHRLPLDTERGYHIQYTGLQSLLNRPVCWNAAGFYATPMDEGLRLAGTVEIAGFSEAKNPRILSYLKRKGEEMFDLPEQPDQEWLGFRPSLPDALPAIGYSPYSEYVLFAFGHHHLGLTLAGITGKLIAELINKEEPSHNLTPFNPARFR